MLLLKIYSIIIRLEESIMRENSCGRYKNSKAPLLVANQVLYSKWSLRTEAIKASKVFRMTSFDYWMCNKLPEFRPLCPNRAEQLYLAGDLMHWLLWADPELMAVNPKTIWNNKTPHWAMISLKGCFSRAGLSGWQLGIDFNGWLIVPLHSTKMVFSGI